MPEKTKAVFNLLKKAPEIIDGKGNVLLVSRQEIVQGDGSTSQHISISKIKRNSDGSQQGNVKSLFVPVGLVASLIKAIQSLEK
jgi:hypothetical protein